MTRTAAEAAEDGEGRRGEPTLAFEYQHDRERRPHDAGDHLGLSGGIVTPGHVAVSLGGDQAISLWNQPNNVDAVQRIRVTELMTFAPARDLPQAGLAWDDPA